MSISKHKKLRWFDAGAEALRQLGRLGPDASPVYVCPTCVEVFPRSSVESGELTAEHVPPESLGGRELVLTCKECNNTAGSEVDAHAHRKETVAAVIEGRLDRVQKVKVLVDGVTANARLTSADRQFTAWIPDSINPPGTKERLRNIRRGQPITVDFSGDAFAELGARISWLRSGYLVLFAAFGYRTVFDPSLKIVQDQIRDSSKSLMRSFMVLSPEPRPASEHDLIEIVGPADKKGWAVQFGNYFVMLPEAGDVSFYERFGRGEDGQRLEFRGQSYEWPEQPFGLREAEAASGEAGRAADQDGGGRT